MIQSIAAIVLVLGGLIFFHELGHFIIARLFRVGVTIFSLGFGPALLNYKVGRTDYRLSAVPLGGYVNMVGEQPDQELPEGFGEADSFTHRPAWQRMCIVAAGPVFNFVLAFLLYWVIFWGWGQLVALPVVGGVVEGSPAQAAGIEPGDRITAIDGQAVKYWDELVQAIGASGGKALTLRIQRQGAELEKTLTPKVAERETIFGEKKPVPMIGIRNSGDTETIPMGSGDALVAAGQQTWAVVSLTVQGIIKMLERVVPMESIGGPIMIAQLVSEQAHKGLVNVLSLAALISINLGLLNLLPIPVLDGGHILFFGIEVLTGRPLSERWQAVAIKVGLTLLLALMVLATYNDILRQMKNF